MLALKASTRNDTHFSLNILVLLFFVLVDWKEITHTLSKFASAGTLSGLTLLTLTLMSRQLLKSVNE